MLLPVYWSSRFVRDYQTYLQYLIDTYSLQVAQEFDDQTTETIKLISQYRLLWTTAQPNEVFYKGTLGEVSIGPPLPAGAKYTYSKAKLQGGGK